MEKRKVGLLGISYYAVNQWQVAALRPPHLAAICPWEGASDYYREFAYHAGILDTFASVWYPFQVSAVQHGGGGRGDRNPNTGELIAGPDDLPQEELVANRAATPADLLAHPFDDAYHRERSPDLERITVPLLSAANWAHHLHTRGNFEGYMRVSSRWSPARARSRICCCPSSRARPGAGPRSGADRSPAPEELQQAIADMRTGWLGKIPSLTT